MNADFDPEKDPYDQAMSERIATMIPSADENPKKSRHKPPLAWLEISVSAIDVSSSLQNGIALE